MATFSRVKTWVSNEVLTAADLNGEFDNIINNMTPSGIEDASANVSAMQTTVDPGGVGTESLATALLGEIQRLRFAIKRIVGAQWYVDPGRYLTTGNLGVQTADIAAGAVTRAKIAALGQQVSSSCGAFSTGSTSLVDVTNLTVTITTTGRPVWVGLQPDGDAVNNSALYGTIALVSDVTMIWAILRATSIVCRSNWGIDTTVISSTQPVQSVTGSVGQIWYIDTPAAGTYTYKFQMCGGSATQTVGINYAKLVAFEIG